MNFISRIIEEEITASIETAPKLNVLLCGNLSSPKDADSRRPSGRINLPLAIFHNDDSRIDKILRITIPDMSLARRHLLWYLLFREITILEWFILSYLLDNALRGGRIGLCACLAGVLSQSSSSREGELNWNSLLRPIHRSLSSKFPIANQEGNDKYKSLLELVLHELKIPKKAVAKSELYTVSEIVVPKKHHPEKPYMGVGYKDKGNLPKDDRPEPITFLEEDWKPSINARLREALNYWTEISSKFSG